MGESTGGIVGRAADAGADLADRSTVAHVSGIQGQHLATDTLLSFYTRIGHHNTFCIDSEYECLKWLMGGNSIGRFHVRPVSADIMATTEESLHTRLSELLAGQAISGKYVRKYFLVSVCNYTFSGLLYSITKNTFPFSERFTSSHAKITVGPITTIDNTVGDTVVSGFYKVRSKNTHNTNDSQHTIILYRTGRDVN